MYKPASLFLIALASFAALAGCAKSRAIGRARIEIPPSRPSTPEPPIEKSIATSAKPRKWPHHETTDSKDTLDIRLVNGREDSSDSLPVPEGLSTSPASVPNQGASPAPIPQSSELTLAQLEALAMQYNPTIVQAQAEIEVDQGFLKQAGIYPNPLVGYVNATASKASVQQSNGIFASQEFVTAHKLDLAQQSILQEIKQMQWDQEAQRMRVMNDLKIRYYEVLGAQQAIVMARKLVAVASETVDLTERVLAAKNATRSDVLQAKMQLESARLNLDDAEFRYSAAWEQLVVIVGIPSLQPAPLTGDLMAEIPELDRDACLQRLLANSPQLGGSASQLDHGRAELRSQCAQSIPNVTVQSVVTYDKSTSSTTASTLIAMPFPIYNRNQGNIDKAAADIRLFHAEVLRVELVLRDQLADSFRRYKSSRRQAEVLKQAILPNSEENLKLSREIYAAGETNFNAVLTAQQSYFQNQTAYIEAVTELHKVVAEIEGLQLTGGLNPPAIGSAIQAQPGGGAQRQRNLLKDLQDRSQKQLLPAASVGL